MSPKDDDDMEGEGIPPGAPTNLEVSDFEATSVTLKWKAPSDDGGAPIKEYLIQYRQPKEEEWVEGPKVKAQKIPSGEVPDLTTNTKYEFRVRAINRIGEGDVSDPTEPVLVKAQKAPPKIDTKVFGESVTCKVNQQLVLEVPVEGAPPPSTSWWKDDAELTITEGIKVVHNPNVAKLMFIPATRSHCGKYTLKATNKWGEASAESEIIVHGKPEMPRGPLAVSDVTKKTCLLTWKPPADHGGHQISHYEVEKLDTKSDQWLPIKSVKGLSLEVTNLVEGKSYKFLVRAVNEMGDSPDLVTEEETVAKNPFDPPSQPGKPDLADWGEDFAELSWKASNDDGGAEINGYRAEVRNRDKRAWKVAGTTGAGETNYRVTNHIEAGNEYEFRVVALNKGGESEPSPSSNTILAKTRFMKPKINKDLLPKEKSVHANQMLRIEAEIAGEPLPAVTWSFPSGKSVLEEAPDRCTVQVEEGRATFTMKDVTRADAGNYQLLARNTEGFDEVELRLEVMAPPSKPKGFLDISGVHPTGCKLSWRKPEDDGGSPILGYNVEKKDVERDVWVACGKVSGKSMAVMKMLEFEVTGLIETFVYMFRVAAFNQNGEGEPLESKIPMMAKHAVDPPEQPSTPRIVDYDKKWVKLSWWAPSESNIKHYIVEMQEQFLVPKDVEQEPAAPAAEGAAEGDGEGAVVEDLSPALKAAMAKANAGPAFSGEFEEYCSAWIMATMSDDATPEVKVTDLAENHRYVFRIKAVNSAGPSWPSDPTEEVVCKVKKQKPSIQSESLKPVCVSRGSTITLSAKVVGEPTPTKAWYYGKIEIKPCPSVEVVEKEHSIKLVMTNARRDDTGIYTLKVDNDHGQDQVDVDVVVMVPPSKPKGPLKISDIYAEGCTCEWATPEDDGGTPVTHYLVEKAEGASTTFVVCGRTNADTTKCQITGLKPEKEHRLQVVAVNAEGQSDPLECVEGFFPENPFVPPGAPGRPEYVSGDFDHFEVKWEEPKNDGGSRITSYQIDAKMAKDTNWFRAGEDKLTLCKAEAGGGVEVGQTYTVRVRALNAAGHGPWSLESDAMICRHKALKPKVTFKGVAAKEIVTFKAGETMSFAVNIEGEPPAHDVVWTLAEKQLDQAPGNGITIDNTKDYKSSLTKEGLSRKDRGILTCTATNMHGKGATSIEINVVSKPSMPEDRLLVSNVHRGGCRLNWKASQDDGGLPTEYVVEKFVAKADAWVKHGTTTSTVYDVNDLENGLEYAFSVKAVNSAGESDALPTAKLMVAKDQYTIPLPPSAPNVKDWSEHHMEIEWSVPIDDGGAPVTGYHVEAKSKGEEDEWQLWETVDTNRTKAVMQKLQNGKEYQFRVIAQNKAGKSDPSHPSRGKVARARNLPPYIDAKNLHDITAIAGDRIKFDLPIFGEPTPDVVWTRSGDEEPLQSSPDKNLVITTTETSTKLVINNVSKEHKGVYTCTVNNASGSDSAKGEVKVLDRPEPPETLSASVDGDKCVLMWKKSRDDGGAPIEHYQVERFELDHGCWMACGKSKDNTFDARGLQVGREYRFRVSAVNEYGDSDPAETIQAIIIGPPSDVDGSVRNIS